MEILPKTRLKSGSFFNIKWNSAFKYVKITIIMYYTEDKYGTAERYNKQ